MAPLVTVALTALLLKDEHFLAAFILENFGIDGGAIHEGRAELHGFTFADREDRVDGHGVTGFRFRVPVDEEDVAFLNGELPALGFDCRFHWKKRATKEALVEKASTFPESPEKPLNAGWRMEFC